MKKPGICEWCRPKLPYVKEPRCMKCGKPIFDEEKEYCLDCTKHPLAYDQGKSVWIHKGTVPGSIYQFKFHNKRYQGAVFAEEMAERYGDWIRACSIETILPVPLHPSKRRQRGFNQAEVLAQELGKRVNLPVETDVVFRVKKTLPQKKLGDKERIDNLKQAFAVSKQWKPKKAVLVIDDIYTTGNTIHRIAKVLKLAGVEKVYFLTISIGQGL